MSRQAVTRHMARTATDKDRQLAACATLAAYLTITSFVCSDRVRYERIFATVVDWAGHHLGGEADVARIESLLTGFCQGLPPEKLSQAILRRLLILRAEEGADDGALQYEILTDIVSQLDQVLMSAITGAGQKPKPVSAPASLTFSEYKELRAEKKIAAFIPQRQGLRLINSLPARHQRAHLFWSWVWMLCIPASIAVSILWKWWGGLAILLTVVPVLSAAIKVSAAQMVLEHAESNEPFFNLLVANNLITFQRL